MKRSTSLLFLAVSVKLTSAQDATATTPTACSSTPSPSRLSDIFWQLRDLEENPPTLGKNVYIGHQNQTFCCLRAVGEALAIVNGTLVKTNDFIQAAPDDLIQKAIHSNQFPCDAIYNGNPSGAPLVEVPYAWWADNCPGWQLNDRNNLESWLQPLSGFLIPAIPLIFSIPRRRKLEVYRQFFIADLSGVKSYLAAPLGALGAAIIVILDTVIWLSTCFAFAAPMILSGLYEAVLDNRMLEFLKEKMQNKRLTLDMRARCLMVILIGNLDLALDDGNTQSNQLRHSEAAHEVIEGQPGDLLPRQAAVAETGIKEGDDAPPGQQSHLPPEIDIEEPSQTDDIELSSLTERGNERPRRVSTSRSLAPSPLTGLRNASPTSESTMLNQEQSQHPPNIPSPRQSQVSFRSRFTRKPTVQQAASPWRHMENLLYEIRLYDDEDRVRGEFPRQWSKHICNNSSCENLAHVEKPRKRDTEFESFVAKTRTRLRTMLHCQYSFGTIVGAPVIFFLGGFIFALLSSLEQFGDQDIAEALAFGQWYMIIPHISIISGLLLAGNNPNILEGVFATERGEEVDVIRFFGLRFGLAFPSCYKTAWQWRRGHVKKGWIEKIISTYGTRKDHEYMGQTEEDKDMMDLRERTTLVAFDWVFILALMSLLIYVPYILAFMTSYFTPPIGLACRSLTSSVYACSQAGQILLWFWTNVGEASAEGYTDHLKVLDYETRNTWLHRSGFFKASSISWLTNSNPHWNPRMPWLILKSKRVWTARMLWCVIYHFFAVIFGIGAVFSVLGGTTMQLMGVYSANICSVQARYWLSPHESRPGVVASKNTAAAIEAARSRSDSTGLEVPY
ncbi:hypothetical protein TruAng_007386 [Truncatella angustata]|nr:hypothetical protein TruAng_007386 [Truncatella angustata]